MKQLNLVRSTSFFYSHVNFYNIFGKMTKDWHSLSIIMSKIDMLSIYNDLKSLDGQVEYQNDFFDSRKTKKIVESWFSIRQIQFNSIDNFLLFACESWSSFRGNDWWKSLEKKESFENIFLRNLLFICCLDLLMK